MSVNGVGGGMSPYMQGVQNTQRNGMANGVNPRDIAKNDMAEKMLPLQVAETAGRAMSEAKGMFVDTYA